MTKISSGRLVRRETQATDRMRLSMRPIVVELHPFYITIGVKRTREFYNIPWDVILDVARKIDARERLAVRQQKTRRRA